MREDAWPNQRCLPAMALTVSPRFHPRTITPRQVADKILVPARRPVDDLCIPDELPNFSQPVPSGLFPGQPLFLSDVGF